MGQSVGCVEPGWQYDPRVQLRGRCTPGGQYWPPTQKKGSNGPIAILVSLMAQGMTESLDAWHSVIGGQYCGRELTVLLGPVCEGLLAASHGETIP